MDKNDDAFRAALQALDEELERLSMTGSQSLAANGYGMHGICGRQEHHGSSAQNMALVR